MQIRLWQMQIGCWIQTAQAVALTMFRNLILPLAVASQMLFPGLTTAPSTACQLHGHMWRTQLTHETLSQNQLYEETLISPTIIIRHWKQLLTKNYCWWVFFGCCVFCFILFVCFAMTGQHLSGTPIFWWEKISTSPYFLTSWGRKSRSFSAPMPH